VEIKLSRAGRGQTFVARSCLGAHSTKLTGEDADDKRRSGFVSSGGTRFGFDAEFTSNIKRLEFISGDYKLTPNAVRHTDTSAVAIHHRSDVRSAAITVGDDTNFEQINGGGVEPGKKAW